MEECLIVLIHKKGNTSDIRHKKLQTNQFASHYVQDVFKHFSAKDYAYAGLPPITCANRIYSRLFHRRPPIGGESNALEG